MRQDAHPPWNLHDDLDTVPTTARGRAAALPSMVRRVLRPGQPGTIKLQRRFGPVLQAVRYRYDATGLYRFTTVELLVEQTPITRGRSLQARFAVRIGFHEERLRAQVRQQGGKWHAAARVWILSGRAVQLLNLVHRVDLTIDTAFRRTARPTSRQPQET